MSSIFSYLLIEETTVSLLKTAIFGVKTLSASLHCKSINGLDFRPKTQHLKANVGCT
jgi:hypothetical protein